MIPKKIHYCWFGGGEKSKLAKKCIESWRKYCPDYEIIEWNEDNFDVNQNAYTRKCIAEKKYAFLSDYARLVIIEEHGGVYFDTDVEVLRNIDDLLENEAYFGFENDDFVNTGEGFGAVAHHQVVTLMREEYSSLMNEDTEFVSCPVLNTRALDKIGLIKNGREQMILGAKIYPVEYLNPFDDTIGKLYKTKNTYSVHWYSKSWLSKGTVLRSKITKPFHRLFGVDCFAWLKRK